MALCPENSRMRQWGSKSSKESERNMLLIQPQQSLRDIQRSLDRAALFLNLVLK